MPKVVNKSENVFDCTVVVVSGGKPRIDLTVHTLKSINNQKLQPKEKIFINHGHTENTMQKISDSKELNSGWKIIGFPINTYDPNDPSSLYKYIGPASLDASTSDYIFFIADDDLVGVDFFERMSKLITNNTDVIVATGLAVELNEEGSIVYPPKGSWEKRDKYEHGISVYRNIYRPDELYQPNPGHSYIIKRRLLLETRDTIFTFGFPDLTPLFQIIPRGIFAYDKKALMLRKLHNNQIHNEWDRRNTELNFYLPHYKKMLELNLGVMKTIQGLHKEDLKLGKRYFQRLATRSCWLAINNVVPDIDSNYQTLKTPFWTKMKYFSHMIKTPMYSFRMIFQPGRIKKFLFRIDNHV